MKKIFIRTCMLLLVAAIFSVFIYVDNQNKSQAEKPVPIKGDRMYEYQAKVIRVVDGDTLWLDIDLGMDIHVNQTIRLAYIDAPEMSTKEGQTAKAFIETLCPKGATVKLGTIKDHKEKYGRYLGVIFVPGLIPSVNEHMVDRGHAEQYTGGAR